MFWSEQSSRVRPLLRVNDVTVSIAGLRSLFRRTIMRLFIQIWIVYVLFVSPSSAHTHIDYTTTNDPRVHGSCMINTNNFNRSCIYDKVVYLARKIPFITKWTTTQMGPLELVKLPNYATGIMPIIGEVPNSRSYSDNVILLISKSLEYFLNSYGIKIRLPPQDKNFPGVIVEDLSDDTISIDENESRRHKKKEAKRFALIFPLIATFKFILIKALLVPILLGIIAIKKMLVMAALAVPMVFTVLRLCRWGGFGFGPLTAAAGAATSSMMAAPYGVASDMYIGDFANNIPSLMPAAHQPYHNKQQAVGDYGGKSLSSFNPLGNLNNYQ